MSQPPTSPTLSHNRVPSVGRDPVLNTDVDDPSHPLHHHRRVVSDFEYGDILGEGSYSTVLIGRDKKTRKQYAIKRLDKAHIVKNNKVKYVMIERDALSKMNHPGIVKLYWTFKDNRCLYFVLDLARNGELYTYIRRLAPFDMDTARFYAAEILLAIEHIHSKGVIHRDIKPENILLDDNLHIKITDFGSAKILQENEPAATEDTDNGPSRSFVGTAEYVSPELLRSDPVSYEADLWAFGCVVYQMLTGKSPFKAATDYLIFQKIKNLEYTIPDTMPSVGKDLVQKLLLSEPEKRLTLASIKEHPFFEGVDWDTAFTANAPALKERLEKEAKAQPPPTFDFGQDEEDEDDIWVEQQQQQPKKNNPFQDQLGTSTPSSSTSTHDLKRISIPERLGGQAHPPWIPHLYPNESVIKAGKVTRKRGFISKKRNLILTNRPRLLYLDEGSDEHKLDGNLRCEIPWTSQLLPELKGKSTFCIHTPEKSYTFEDRQYAQDWVNIINSMLIDSFGVAA